MYYNDFENCRAFLETQIDKNPENSDLVKAYVSLFENKTKFDIAYINGDKELRQDFEKNQTERIKSYDEITKKSIS